MGRAEGADRWPIAADVVALDLAALVAAFNANTAAYFAGRRSDDRFALELFRRAVLERDDEAWRAIYDAYLPLVTGWVVRQPAFPHCGEDSAYLVACAFERFWRALRPDRLAGFPNLPALLRYLKLCAHCAVADAARSRRSECYAEDCPDIPAEGRGGVEQAEASVGAEHVWQAVARAVRDDAEERLAWDTLVLGLAPREVIAERPDAWRSVVEVYEARAAMLRRLRASPELVMLRESPRSGGHAAA